ncbi:MAG: DUF3455 domain-containing protein [Myxococcales bacterium]|nr:DUF3455 domain-containing protein [Myxococcales bacterium]
MAKRSLLAWAVIAAGTSGCPDRDATSGPPSSGTAAALGAPGDACPSEWLRAPAVAASIAVPDGGGAPAIHVAASGTQNYACARAAGDGGAGFAWIPVGPEATLSDCRGAVVGSHFGSDAGASAPEWQLRDGSYVVGRKLAASTPPEAAGAVPWLLLGADGRGGSGPLANARFVQRVATRGGVAPSGGCDAGTLGAVQKVPYQADYYFYGP